MGEGRAKLWQLFLGADYAGFKVWHYAAGTTTDKTVWSGADKSASQPQPMTADSNGWISFYADGDYRFDITDCDNTMIQSFDPIRITQDVAAVWEGSNGTVSPPANDLNAWHLFVRHDGAGMFEGLEVSDGNQYRDVTWSINAGVFNIKEPYGAVGDGVTDDAAAIQAALDAADTAGGGTVFAPDGTYLIGSALTIGDNTCLWLNHNAVFLRGFADANKPEGATIRNKLAPDALTLRADPGPYIQTQVNKNICIRGGEWRTDNATFVGSHINLLWVKNALLHDFRMAGVFENWNIALYGDYIKCHGIHIDNGDDSIILTDGIHIYGGQFIDITNCTINVGDDAIAIGSNLNLPASDISISNCAVRSNQGKAVTLVQRRSGSTAAFGAADQFIQRVSVTNVTGKVGITRNGMIEVLHGAGAPDNTLIRDVLFGDCAFTTGTEAGHDTTAAWGVRMEGGHRFTFSDVIIDSPIRSAFRLEDTSEVKISGCTAFGIQQTATGRYTVDANDSTNTSVIGCDMENLTTHNMKFEDCVGVKVIGNYLRGIKDGFSGIDLAGVTSRVVIQGNSFEPISGGTTPRGVLFLTSATLDDILITGNDFSQCERGVTISATPTNWTVSDNLLAVAARPVEIGSGAISQAALSDWVALTGASSAADVLFTINDGYPGQQLRLTNAVGPAAILTCDDGGGNLQLASDRILSSTNDVLLLMFDGTNWLEVGYSSNG